MEKELDHELVEFLQAKIKDQEKVIKTLTEACDMYKKTHDSHLAYVKKLRESLGLGESFFSDSTREIILSMRLAGRKGVFNTSYSFIEDEIWQARYPEEGLFKIMANPIKQLAIDYIRKEHYNE